MSLKKESILDQIQISNNGVIQLKFVVTIYENDEKISASDSYKSIAPGADVSTEDAKVKAICAAVHTADVVSAYQAAQAAKGV
jgi:hypothetical protein